jgi:hypothetical protein
MSTRQALESEARERRDLAKSGRRIAGTLHLEADRQRLLQFVVELEQQADRLETQAADLPR